VLTWSRQTSPRGGGGHLTFDGGRLAVLLGELLHRCCRHAAADTCRTSPQVLRRFAKGAGIELEFDERGRLASGPETEHLFSQWVWRLTRALGCGAAGLALSRLLLLVAPPLSRSTPQSIAVAAVSCAAIVGPYLFLRPFLRPLPTSNAGTVRPAVAVEDYLSPPLRVLLWLAGASVLIVPVAAAALATTRAYEARRSFGKASSQSPWSRRVCCWPPSWSRAEYATRSRTCPSAISVTCCGAVPFVGSPPAASPARPRPGRSPPRDSSESPWRARLGPVGWTRHTRTPGP
jgi:hypothetical protein